MIRTALRTYQGGGKVELGDNLDRATRELKLSPQERNLYQHHLNNLARGGVKNDDGSTSTLLQMNTEVNGRHYNVPTVWDNKIVDPDEAMARSEATGIDRFPSYRSSDEAERRYQQMHQYMEHDQTPRATFSRGGSVRTAIRTYQGGGEVGAELLDERYFPTEPEVTPPVTPTPQASPVQPPPGAAGPTPTPTPPPGAAPPPPPPPEPPPVQGDQPQVVPYGQPRPGPGPRAGQAIDTTGQQTQEFDHDADLPKQTNAETKAWQVQRSPIGDQRILPSQPPETYKNQDDPRWPDYQRAFEIYNKKDTRTQTKLRPQLNKLYGEIDADTKLKNRQEHDTFMKDQREQLRKLDADYYKTLQTPNLNGLIDTGLSTTAKSFDDVIQNGTPQQKQEAELKRRMSPLDTMSNSEQKYVIRNILALNKKLDADQAAQVLTLIGSPVMPGQKGVNGFTGRAGTKYAPDSTDLLGNRQIRVPGFGLIRITPEFLDTVNKRRVEGYNAGLKYKVDTEAARKKAKEPTAFDKAVAPYIDWISKKVQ